MHFGHLKIECIRTFPPIKYRKRRILKILKQRKDKPKLTIVGNQPFSVDFVKEGAKVYHVMRKVCRLIPVATEYNCDYPGISTFQIKVVTSHQVAAQPADTPPFTLPPELQEVLFVATSSYLSS